jgi:D-alanyl-D-alanine carboxypeptidase
MLRRMGVAAVALVVLGSFVFAETYRGTVVKLDDKSITVKHRKDPKDKESELVEKKLDLNDKIEYKLAKRAGKKVETEDSDFKKFKAAYEKDKNIRVTVKTDDDGKVTEISYGGGGKRKKKKDN